MWSVWRDKFPLASFRRQEVVDSGHLCRALEHVVDSSLTAPWKFVPLSEKMVLGLPRRAMNRRSAEMKASVVRLVTTSI